MRFISVYNGCIPLQQLVECKECDYKYVTQLGN